MLCFAAASAVTAGAWAWDGEDAYGPGIHQDRYGRAFEFQTDDGNALPPGVRVRPNAYGPGVGADQYGRPVRGRALGAGDALEPYSIPDHR